MCGSYTLEWLDTLVSVTFNPAKTKIADFLPEQILKIQDQIQREKDKIQVAIKSVVFDLDDEEKIRCSIKKYHSSLLALLDQALENKNRIAKPAFLKPVLGVIINSIDELLTLIEGRFIGYLSINERIPATYFSLIQKDLLQQFAIIVKRLGRYESLHPALKSVQYEIEGFIQQAYDKHTYTFQEIFYLKDLCRELESLKPSEEIGLFSALDELLINFNFNAKGYIHHLTQKIARHVNTSEKTADKMERLIFHLKAFKQLHRKTNIVFAPGSADLHKQISNWFTQEIFYLEKQIHFSIIPLDNAANPVSLQKKEPQKILSILSVDQMALVLRAADEMKIIMARSLNSVFKSIVPHLSTPYQENISYDSMRSKSYAAESRDKEIVIQTLQQMIVKIREY